MTCNARATFTYHGEAVICSQSAGHDGVHIAIGRGPMPLAWGDDVTITGDIAAALEADLRAHLEPIAASRVGGRAMISKTCPCSCPDADHRMGSAIDTGGSVIWCQCSCHGQMDETSLLEQLRAWHARNASAWDAVAEVEAEPPVGWIACDPTD